MNLHIDDSRTLNEIREEFNSRWPFIKLVFFSKHHEQGEGSPKKEMITGNPSIGEIRSKHNEGDITFDGETTVGELESKFWDNYGIVIQVFRKSGHQWLETTVSDSWSLDKQNEVGRDMNERLDLEVG